METASLRPVVLILVGLASGLLIAGASGWGPLAYVSYTIQGGGGGNGTIVTVPARLDLGELQPGQSGTVEGYAVITVSSSGYYEISLEHEDKLKRDFAYFTVNVTINGTSITLSPYGDDDATVYLDAGTYNVTIKVSYIVKDNPQGSAPGNMLLLKIENEDGGHDNS